MTFIITEHFRESATVLLETVTVTLAIFLHANPRDFYYIQLLFLFVCFFLYSLNNADFKNCKCLTKFVPKIGCLRHYSKTLLYRLHSAVNTDYYVLNYSTVTYIINSVKKIYDNGLSQAQVQGVANK